MKTYLHAIRHWDERVGEAGARREHEHDLLGEIHWCHLYPVVAMAVCLFFWCGVNGAGCCAHAHRHMGDRKLHNEWRTDCSKDNTHKRRATDAFDEVDVCELTDSI